MNADEFRQQGKKLIDYIADYLEKDIRNYPPLSKVEPGYLKTLLPQEAPDDPESFDHLMKDVARVIMPGVTHWQSPNFHGYFTSASSYPAICADLLSNGIGCLGFSWIASPACTELEVTMMDWLAKMIQLPEHFISGGKGGGVIQGSASEAVLMALFAARNKTVKEKRTIGDDMEITAKLVAYCSDQAHSSVERACLLGALRCRRVSTDAADEMRGEALEDAIKEDKENGLIPFFVVATLGTTSCCSFDHLAEIGPICEAEGVWLHIDAAYAGTAFICPEFRQYLNGVEFADSFNFNPHKLLLVNFDCSAMWYRDTSHVIEPFRVLPTYSKHDHEGKMPDYRHWHIPFGRRFRSLKLWFVLRMYGLKGIQQHIRKHVSLAKCFEEMVKSDPRFVITHSVTLGLVCFRLKDKSNDVNAELLKRINDDGRIYIVPSFSSKGVYFLRFAICTPRTEVSDLQYAWNVIAEIATSLLDEMSVAS